ncbi:MAG: hypothetical protein AB7V18_19435 [Pyrinomonadaceae bacterium]
MPGNIRTKALEIPMPLRGLDLGMGHNAQPPGTCAVATNVRVRTTNDRSRIGSRYGHSKVFTTQAGETGSRRINALAGFDNTPAEGIGTDGAPEEQELDPTVPLTGNDIGAGWLQVTNLGFSVPRAEASTAMTITAADKVLVTNRANGLCDAVVSQYKTTNKATAVVYATAEASTAGIANDGPLLSIARCGPFIRGSQNLKQALALTMLYTASNTVRVVVVSIQDSGITNVWSSSMTHALSGSTTQTDCTMTIEEIDSSTVRIAVTWPGEFTETDTLALSTFNGSGNNRSGFVMVGPGAGATRELSSLTVERIPQSTGVVVDAVNASDPNTVGSAQFFVPDGWSSVRYVQSTTTLTQTDGPAESASAIAGTCVDTSNDTIEASATPAALDMFAMALTDNPASRYAVGAKIGTQVSNAGCQIHFFTRISDDFDSYIRVNVLASRNITGTKMIDTSTSIAVSTTVISNGVQVGSTTTRLAGDAASATAAHLIWRLGDLMVLTDTGEDGDSTFTLSVLGFPLLEWTMTTAEIGSAAAAGLYDGNGDSWRRVGVGSPATTNELNQIGVVEAGLLPEGGESSGSTDFGRATFYIAAFTDGAVDVGSLETLELSRCGGTAFSNSIPVQAAPFQRKLYCVNGDQSLIVDPLGLSITDWASSVTAGSLPSGCKIAATYRGRLVLANTASNPAIYYMSRTLDPLDWDFGADPQATTAIAGNNAAFGQPGSTVLALIPYGDDYLIFGCPNDLYMMEGDPGYGGRVQVMSRETGIAGPRAWTFDENGTLFFLGQAGLYRLPRGSLIPESVSGGRLDSLLDTVDFNDTLVQLAYSASDGLVGIFLTPSDGTVGTHVIYDIGRDAFVTDQYPADFGPWSVLTSTGTADIDRQWLLGCNDGYVRRKDNVRNDDGTAISSVLRMFPVFPPKGQGEALITEFQAEFSTSSGTLSWYWLADKSAAELSDLTIASAAASGSFSSGGFQDPVRIRVRGGAHILELRQSSSSAGWDLERAVAYFGMTGRRRSA